MEHDVFISYSRKDSDIANKIYDTLTAEGMTCFIDRQGISGGADFPTVLSEAIMGAKVLLLIASENSYASEFTQKEITFAVSNKGSKFIFPLIVDGSTLPKNLEFMLSNINWRTLSNSYTVEKDLVKDIKYKLANPHAGETLKQKEKHTVKIMMIVISVVVAAALALVLGQSYQQNREKAQREAEEQEARTAHLNCLEWISSAEKSLSRADSLHRLGNTFNTFDDEVLSLNEVSLYVNKVDSVKNVYRMGSYNSMFLDISASEVRSQSNSLRKELYDFWNYYAKVNYNDYKSYKDEYTRTSALNYIEKALLVKPDDAALLQMKENLTK